ncbi:GNAT family N-acetyltransferase [Halocynthiibacter sp. C4]|uniref:GNAT family N-acetyltransferase n=1 Tax=Halocynthiibacter sp. C4 TaxID=2992758 RepID=UPI00237BB888|nr:GNAT family N-acetyltransferase [Halocynthiibacter sp. C4]MDE0590361.1 GNAT family N-acetyltransferase [Halocynthiibacter sp. C4]
MTDPSAIDWDAGRLAALHARCFTVPRPWRAEEFDELLATRGCFLAPHDHGFALGRVIADEAELLTLAVSPDMRRRGYGNDLLRAYESRAAQLGAAESFLEVAETNLGAIALYRANGYIESGRRRRYYAVQGGNSLDALIMRKQIGNG